MERVPYGRMGRKGLNDKASGVWGVLAGAGVSTALLPETQSAILGQIGAQVDLEPLSLQMRFRYGSASSRNAFLGINQRVFGLDFAALKLFDVWRLSMGFGVRVGVDRISQDFETTGSAPARISWTGRAGPVLYLGYTPVPWMSVFLEGSGDAHLLKLQSLEEESQEVSLRFVPQAVAGLTFYVF